MKKIFAIALAVVMVLSIASVAGAFNWSKPAEPAEPFGYSVDVIKFTRSTGTLGSSSFNEDNAATAVNGADVYWAIKLVVPSLSYNSGIRQNAQVDVKFTALDGTTNVTNIPLRAYPAGTYYFLADGRYVNTPADLPFVYTANEVTWGTFYFWPVSAFGSFDSNNIAETPVYATNCLDTATAKVEAKVYSERPLDGSWFEVGSYEVAVNDRIIAFRLADTDKMVATFTRNADDLVVGVTYGDAGDTETMKLYEWLNNGSATEFRKAVENKEVYMTNANLRAAFGFTYSQSDSITWNANSTPIILDPTVSIPKTGDNASVIGFAMIMVAVVAAAVAVRKVNA